MRTKKQLLVCLTVCLVLSFVSAVYAASLELPRALAPVIVVNPNSKPIPVTEVRKYPVQGTVVANFLSPAWYVNKYIYEVPANKLLVIEYFSCQTMGTYSTSYSCGINTNIGDYPNDVTHWLPTTPYGHSQMLDGIDPVPIKNPWAYMTSGQRVQLYAEPGAKVLVMAFRQNQAIKSVADYPNESIVFSFSGYLVDAALPVDIGSQ
jgi:hypothetical protein